MKQNSIKLSIFLMLTALCCPAINAGLIRRLCREGATHRAAIAAEVSPVASLPTEVAQTEGIEAISTTPNAPAIGAQVGPTIGQRIDSWVPTVCKIASGIKGGIAWTAGATKTVATSLFGLAYEHPKTAMCIGFCSALIPLYISHKRRVIQTLIKIEKALATDVGENQRQRQTEAVSLAHTAGVSSITAAVNSFYGVTTRAYGETIKNQRQPYIDAIKRYRKRFHWWNITPWWKNY